MLYVVGSGAVVLASAVIHRAYKPELNRIVPNYANITASDTVDLG